MSGRRSSGLDFSDRRDALDALDAHPDIVLQRGPSASLQRNKTERRRLQGVMRTTAAVEGQTLPSQMKDTKIMERYQTWLINGGRAKLILGFYIFLHILVIVFGFMLYQLKDTFTGTRNIVSVGFGTSLGRTLLRKSPQLTARLSSNRPYRRTRPPFRCHIHPFPDLQKLHLAPPPDAIERYHSFRR